MAYKQGKNKRELSRIMYFLRRYLIYIVVLAVLIVGIVATMRIYDNSVESETSSAGESVRLVQADTYNLAMYEPSTFNMITSMDEDVVYLNQIIYSFLFRLDDTLNIVPDLVDSYSTNSEDGTVSIKIRSDAVFSNGFNVTANDVEKTVTYIKEAGNDSPYYQYVSKIDNISIEGEREFTLKFSNPTSAALDNLVFPILCATTYKKGDQFAVGSGEYAYSTYEEGTGIKLIPNENYYGESSKLPIDIMFVKDKNSLPGMATMDAVTGFISKDQNADNIAEDKSLRCVSIVSSDLEYMGFNCKNSFLSNPNVRRAVSMAVDREKTIRDDYGSGAVISDSLYYPGFLGAEKDSGIKYDPKASTDLIGAAGYKDIDEDGVLEDEQGEDLILTLIVNSKNSNRTDAADSIAADLRSIGINVEVRALDDKEFDNALNTGNFDLYLLGLKIDKQFRLLNLYDEDNYGFYEGDRVVRLTKELEMAHTREQQSSIFRELKSELYDEMPYFGICYMNYYFVSSKTLETGDNPQFFNPYRSIGRWIWQKRVSTEQ